MKKLFLFDIDGTLIHSPISAGKTAFEEAFFAYSGIKDALKNITLHGNTDYTILHELWHSCFNRQPTEEEARTTLSMYLDKLQQSAKRPGAIQILPGVESAINRIAELGHSFGLATGNIREGARIKLEAVGIWQSFSFGGFGCDSPSRSVLIKAAILRAETFERQKFSNDSVWIIGDTPRDISAAHEAGVKAIGVATGLYNCEELRHAGADIVCGNLSQLDFSNL